MQRQQNVYFDIGNVGPGFPIESQKIVLTLLGWFKNTKSWIFN